MFSRATGNLSAAAGPLLVNTRGMATLKDISIRLKSIKNIQKITKSMKMVAAAKYGRSEKELKPARPYGEGATAFYHTAMAEEAAKPEHLMVLMSSDRGLCGGIHSNIAKMVKRDIEEEHAGKSVKIFCVGDKAKAIFQRTHSGDIVLSANDLGKRPPSFEDATILAEALMNSGYDWKSGDLYFNRFKSVVSFTTTKVPIYSVGAVAETPKLAAYDSLDAEVIQSYMEYSLASLLYYTLKEGNCSEQSSRMTAMDGASKNAGEMIDKLTLYYNRTRQAVITKELIEIISGAAAL